MSKKQIICENAPSAIGTYSQAVKVDKFIFISGQIPLDYRDMSIVDGSFELQVETIMTSLKNIAESAGADLNDCVKLTVYLKDLENFPLVNKVMEKFLSEPYPSRAALEVSRLPKDVQVEIDAVLFKE
tara:strand:+ start:78 stop:461 length:384 start_codon:yes stop_codon:yes gene_type:complete